MTALIKYSVGGIMMVVLLGCQPTSAPTASVPSVLPEQFETPTPTPTPTDAQMLRTPQPSVTPTTLAQASTQAESGEVAIASPPAGTYVCLAMNGKQAGILTLSPDGLYTMNIPDTATTPAREETGGYRLDGDTKIGWRAGAFVKRYGGVSTLVFDTDFATIVLAEPGDSHSRDLTCNRQP